MLGLDLLQIAFKDNIPVCQFVNYDKLRYEQQKKQKENKKKQQKIVMKEIQLSPRIDKHDIQVKLNQINNFINQGFTVRVVMSFRGRENSYKELGVAILEQFRNIPGTLVTEYNSTGNQINMNIVRL